MWKKWLKRILVTVLCIFILSGISLAVVASFALSTIAAYDQDLHNQDYLLNRNKRGMLLEDRNGLPFFAFYPAQTDSYIPLSSIPLTVQQAVIVVEDRTFYTNPGFSIKGITRALIVNTINGQVTQGGSTISQEFVKNSLLNSNKSLTRKFQEIVLAYRLNQIYTKQQILEMYLNSVYFGEGAYGIQNAARTYFGINAPELTLAQAALLAGMLPAPSEYSPFNRDPGIAKSRQQLVLRQMQETDLITPLTASTASRESISYQKHSNGLNTYGHHFALYVRDQLIKQYGEDMVNNSGLTVRTTLNSEWQKQAEAEVTNQVDNLAKNGATNGAAVVIDPQTGQILAMVGSTNWFNDGFGKVNMATTPRQVGSAFKPIVYTAAFIHNQITPATILQDKPTQYPGDYSPKNYDGQFRGPVTVRRALANSLNIPAVEVMQLVGVPNALDMAKQFGITSLGSPSDYGLSLVLGSGEVNLVELTNAYAVFAAEGVYHPPTAIVEVKDQYKNIIYSSVPSSMQIIPEGVAYLISSILSDTKTRAEEFGSTLNIPRTAAVKTGTSQDYRNALTVGYTPNLAIGVWVGNNDNSTMDKIAGSLGAAPIWKNLMTTYLDGEPDIAFTLPYSIAEETVCPYSHTSSSLASSSAYPEFFLAGTEPIDSCSILLPLPEDVVASHQISSHPESSSDDSPPIESLPIPSNLPVPPQPNFPSPVPPPQVFQNN